MSVLPFGNFSEIGQPAAGLSPRTRDGDDFAQFMTQHDDDVDGAANRRLDEFPDLLAKPENTPQTAMVLPFTLFMNNGTAIPLIAGGETQSLPEGVSLPMTAPVIASSDANPAAGQPAGNRTTAPTANGQPMTGDLAVPATGAKTPDMTAPLTQQAANTPGQTSANAAPTIPGNAQTSLSGQAQSAIAALLLPQTASGAKPTAPAPSLSNAQAGSAAANVSGRSAIAGKSGAQVGATQNSAQTSASTSPVVTAGANTSATSAKAAAQAGSQPSDFSLLVESGAATQTSDPAAELDAPDLQLADISQTAQKADISAPQHVKAASNAQMAAVVAQVSQRMLERFDGKNSKFEIRLDPAELGKIDIKIEVDGDGRVQAVLAASDSTAADALTRGLRSLENALTQAGLSLSENGLRVEINGRNSNQSSAQNDMPGGESSNGSAGSEENTQTAEAISPNTPEIQVWSQSRLDIRA